MTRLQCFRAAGLSLLLASASAWAQETYELDIGGQKLSSALERFAEQSGLQVVYFAGLTDGKRTEGISGSYSAETALAALLENSGLMLARVDERTYSVAAPGTATEADDRGNFLPTSSQVKMTRTSAGTGKAGSESRTSSERRPDTVASNRQHEKIEEVVVTGTRIRGGTTPSPVFSIGRTQVREEGHNDLGEVIRAMPQNFSGGQNPGVSLGSDGITNQNVNSGSALNLRGLGPDATLTLLNGRRLSYSGFVNAVDVSVIPVAALERIEVIADGASAIYGSDAVAGVANIITRREFDGIGASYRLGTATDGGGAERQYGLSAGTTWNSGNVIGAYDYTRTDAIFGRQRSYTEYMLDPNSILPEREQHSGFLSMSQDLRDFATASVDTLFTERDSATIATQPTQNVVSRPTTRVFVISPALDVHLAAGWSLSFGGSYGRDKTTYSSRRTTPAGAPAGRSMGCYCNTSQSIELGAEGPIFALGDRDVRIAAGAGYRKNDFEARSYTSNSVTEGERSSRYVYGEMHLPLVPADGGTKGVRRLNATAAFRHEDYGNTGKVTTPKIGLVYQPSVDFTLKGSWGESYKAPNLLQQFQDYLVYLMPAEQLGASGYPADATALMTWGGKPDLEPERAETWTGSVLFHPQSLSGLELQIGYFDIDYRDRVVQPVGNRAATFRDPVYAEFLDYDPSPELQAQIIAPSDSGLNNFTSEPYDPDKVMGILHNTYVNVARQRVRGIDLSGSYIFGFADGSMAVRGSASWLEGQQQNSAVQPEFDTAGMIFNPPEFRARAGLVWNGEQVMLSAFMNHLGGVTDNRLSTESEVGSFTTVDLNARYATGENSGALSGIDLTLSAQNLLGREPPLVEPIANYVVSYDSTNYSAIGRFVSLSISKRW